MSVAAQLEAKASADISSPFYFNASHWRAIDGVMEGVRDRAGIMVLTGPTGSGKTMLMRAIADGLDQNAVPLFLQYASLNFREFVSFLHSSLKVDDEIVNASNKAVALRKFLYAQAERDETTVLFVDEAQNLEPDVLKMLPKLANFDTLEDGRVVGMQFVLVGGSELREFLDDADFDDVRAAVARSYELRFFTREELKHFLEKRLAPIARMTPEPITDDAIQAVGRYSGGSPRLIGMICSHAMLFAAENPGRSIDEAMIEEAAEALMIEPVENAFAHEDDVPELTGPYSSAELKGETAENAEERETLLDEEEFAPIASDAETAYDDEAVERAADEIDDDDISEIGETEDDFVVGTGHVLEDIGDTYEDEDDRDTEIGGEAPAAAAASGSILAKIKSAVAERRARQGRGEPAKLVGAGRKGGNAERQAAPAVPKRKMKTQVAGERERKIKIGILAAACSGLVFGAYMVREPVIQALTGATAAVSETASRAVDSVGDAASATVARVRGAATGEPQTSQAVVAVPAAGVIDVPAAEVAASDPVPAESGPATTERTGWDAKVQILQPDGTLPAPAVDIARGALDLVDRALDAGAAAAPDSVRGALEQASGDVAELRRTVTVGVGGGDVEARVKNLVSEGETRFADKLYIAPRGGNAYESFREALDLDPENEAALQGIEKLRALYSSKAETARAARQWDVANRHFETALAISRLRPVR